MNAVDYRGKQEGDYEENKCPQPKLCTNSQTQKT